MADVEKTDAIDKIAALQKCIGEILQDDPDADGAIVTSLVWQEDDKDGRSRYFCTVIGSKRGHRVSNTGVSVPDAKEGAGIRSQFIAQITLATSGRAFVIIDTSDELEAAQTAQALWPCAKTRRLLRNTERERSGVGGKQALK